MRLTSLSITLLTACSASSSVTPDGSLDGPAEIDARSPSTFTFHYTPGWPGAQSVEVVGGFGRADDWTTPIATLTASGNTFTGTVELPAGSYPYLLHVIGDASAGTAANTYSRFAIDPASTTFVPCPAASPSYTTAAENPCGQVTMPQVAPAMFHVHGRVEADGAPAAGFLVVIERQETGSHHFFANRATTGADGTYDLSVAAGTYRIQVQHPAFMSKTDAQLATGIPPATMRREISTAFAVAADVEVPVAEVAFHGYAAFAPKTTATLPTTFAFGTAGSGRRLELYGTANSGAGNRIGDPWYVGAATTTSSATFDGAFTSSHATEAHAALGERYFWGISLTRPGNADVTWSAQSLVFPITWH